MEITRSVEIRACEAARRDFLADDGVRKYWGERVYVGPQVGEDSSIVTPQISIVPASVPFEPGVTGVSITEIAFMVMCFEPFRTSPDKIGDITSTCRVRHLKKILASARYNPSMGAFEDIGALVDPDSADSTLTTKRILNISDLSYRDIARQVVTNKDGKPVALLFGFIATFETHLDNVTLDRP